MPVMKAQGLQVVAVYPFSCRLTDSHCFLTLSNYNTYYVIDNLAFVHEGLIRDRRLTCPYSHTALFDIFV